MNWIRKHRVRLLSVLAGLCLISATVTDPYFEITKNLEIFTSVFKELNIYYVDETDPGALMKKAIDEMLKSLDPYTVYYPESKIEDAMFMQTGQYGGIGTLVNTIHGKITITEPYQGYPAAKAGLIAGDVILKINGKSVVGKKHDEVTDQLTGTPGSTVEIEFQRPGETSTRTTKITREEIKVPDVPYFSLLPDSTTGYIQLTGFTQTASQEVRAAYTNLKQRNMQRLILDLRGNGGGLLREAVAIVNFFVPKGTKIVETKGRNEEWNKEYTAINDPLDTQIPLVVLVDHGSASASEIVSGSLQDLDRAVILGEESYGKGLVQQTKDLIYNTKMKLTVAKYYTPSGRCIQRLDYSNRDASTGKVDAKADSLLQVFKTANGREVLDGRGIAPDVQVKEDLSSHLLEALFENWIIFDWVTQYQQEHATIPTPSAFSMSDQEYTRFIEYAKTQDFHYDTQTEKLYQDLINTAKEENYYTGSENEFQALLRKIEPNKEDDLNKFKPQIKRVLESEIVTRYYYQRGRSENTLREDAYIIRALKVFRDEHQQILRGKG
jgi:carboxyl-terminal processing protease